MADFVRNLSFIDLYSGCLGMSLGLYQAGLEPVIMVEIDSLPHSVAQAAISAGLISGTALNLDVGDIDFTSYRGEVDLLAGCPPCQPYSEAGKGLGFSDPRDGWDEYLRAIEEIEPRVVIAENVPPFLSSKTWPWVETVISGMGYCVEAEIINCADLGLPQERRRAIVVAHDGTFNWPKMKGKPWSTASSVFPPGFLHNCRNSVNNPGQERWRHTTREPAQTVTTADSLYIELDSGSRRQATWQEHAALQGFPGNWPFLGSKALKKKMIGNAVPPVLGRALGFSVRDALE